MELVRPQQHKKLLGELDELTFRFEDIPRMLRRTFDDLLVDSGLTRTQWRLLGYVLRKGGRTQTELARLLELERASVGSAIDTLCDRHLVERRKVPGDRRAWAIFATPEAETLLVSLRDAIHQVYAQAFRGLSDHELTVLRSLLDRIVDNLTTT